jgi:hypothetical protein
MKINFASWILSNMKANEDNKTASLYMMVGTPLSKTDLRNTIIDKKDFYSYEEIKDKLDLSSSKCIAFAHYENLNVDYINRSRHMRYPLSTANKEFNVMEAGVPTWFLLVSPDQSTMPVGSLQDQSSVITSLMLGSVGLIGSNTDMEMSNTNFNVVDDFKPGDLSWILAEESQ